MIPTRRAPSMRTLVCAYALSLLGGCFQASHSSEHAGFLVDEPIVFSGYALTPNQEVSVFVAPTQAGLRSPHVLNAWAESSPASTFGSSDRPAYRWRESSTLPSSAWAVGTDADGCAIRSTYALAGERVRRPYPFPGLKFAISPAYVNPNVLTDAQFSCLEERFDAGANAATAIKACVGTVEPLRIVAINRHVGDVVIATQADIDRLRCIDEVDGALSIVADTAVPLDVSLPRLKRVTGDLYLAYTMRPWPGPEAEAPIRCGRPVPTDFAVSRRIALPALKQVNGDLMIETPSVGYTITRGGERVEFGLNALTSVLGTIEFAFHTPTQPCGLDALATHAGTLRMRLHADTTGAEFARALRSVGKIEIEGGVSILSLFDNLQRVGSLRIEHNGTFHNGFGSLQQITGDFEIIGSHFLRRNLPALTRIGGTWRIASCTNPSLHIGSAELTANALTIEGNSFACLAREGTSCPPLAPNVNVRLVPGGRLRIADNPSLPPVEVCALVRLLRERGFRGEPDLDGATCPL